MGRVWNKDKKNHNSNSRKKKINLRRKLRISDPMIITHKINWEASIHGKVTTNPHAGSLLIQDVEVSWQLYDPNDTKIPINCAECFEKVSIHEGGGFDIIFDIDHHTLYNENEKEVPVKITFSKSQKILTIPVYVIIEQMIEAVALKLTCLWRNSISWIRRLYTTKRRNLSDIRILL